MSGDVVMDVGLEKTSRCVNNTIARYNKNYFCTDYKLPKKLARKDVLNPEYYIYFQDDEVFILIIIALLCILIIL